MGRRINNMPLKQKLLAMMLTVMSIMAVMSFVSLQIVSSSYNKMLYRTMAESMSYSAKDITDYMDKIENLTEIFLSDTRVQKDMKLLKNEYEAGRTSLTSLRNTGVYLGEYYQNYSDGMIKYFNLYTPAAVLKTNLIAADKLPQDIQKELVAGATKKDGAPFWEAGYMDSYGLFLARDVRQIEGLKLDTLGTILINIDMNALVKASTMFGEQYGDSAYMIVSDGKLLYHTENLTPEDMEMLSVGKIDQYGIQKTGSGKYFISHGRIEEYGWDYYCLVSYEKMDRQIRGIKRVCVWIILLDFLLVIYLAARMVGKLTLHIASLKDRMQQFARDNTKVPESEYDSSARGDELGMLSRQFDDMSRKIIDLIQQNYVNELLKKEAQLKALENQMNPHFLYNTLDSIKWRAKLIGEKDISDMVEALGVLLRTSLRTDDEKDYTVGREMEIIDSYITIQKLRYEERLDYCNYIGREWYAVPIPKLVLQPLIENAVFYGLELNVDDCIISLFAERKEDCLYFYIKNTGSEIEDDLLEKLEKEEIKPRRNGVSLLNIDKRIKIRFGEGYGLRLYNETDYAVAELRIPLN